MRRVWEAALNLLYPPACCGCGAATERGEFCRECLRVIARPSSPLCVVCGIPFYTAGDTDHRCGRCLERPPRFGQARACAIYAAAAPAGHPFKAVLHRYKYHRDVSLARPLGQLAVERCPLALTAYDLIVPVPLHLSRLRWRGFNQAQLLAHHLARRAGIRLDALSLQRTRSTRPQVELDEAARRRNVAGAFYVTRPFRVAGRRVLLVDDVYTTGSTANECARALRRAGARQVDVLVLARAVLQ